MWWLLGSKFWDKVLRGSPFFTYFSRILNFWQNSKPCSEKAYLRTKYCNVVALPHHRHASLPLEDTPCDAFFYVRKCLFRQGLGGTHKVRTIIVETFQGLVWVETLTKKKVRAVRYNNCLGWRFCSLKSFTNRKRSAFVLLLPLCTCWMDG